MTGRVRKDCCFPGNSSETLTTSAGVLLVEIPLGSGSETEGAPNPVSVAGEW